MTFAILEGNMERLRKKMVRIGNKAKKYGCDFRFEEVGEEFREVKDGENTYLSKFILVEVSGIAKVNGWRFIASVEHTDKGNIIHKAEADVEVPERYYTTAPICEHCGTKRLRKDTYIVQNVETGEFKQVGKSCLKDFTNGMDAEWVAAYMDGLNDVINGEAPMEGGNYARYINVKEFLRYAAETIRHFGYVSRGGGRCTADRTYDYYGADHGWFGGVFSREENLRTEMKECGFNPDSPEAVAETENALAWLEKQEDNSNYMHNLKTVCSLDYDKGNYGIMVSLFPTYNRELEREDARRAKEAERLAREEAEKVSVWVGKVGEKVEIKVKEFRPVTSWDNMYGTVYIYKIVDGNGNVFTWKTGTIIPENVTTIKGTVKEHKEYRGIKQTEVTRCRCA